MVDFQLIVLEPPKILMLESDKAKRPINGTTLTLSCPAQGKPEPTLTWFKDGAQLEAGGEVEVVASGAALRVANVRPESSGRYTCVARNKAGEADQDVVVFVMSKSFGIRRSSSLSSRAPHRT